MARSVARKKVRAAHEASQARLALWEAAGRLASRQQQVVARRRLAELVAAELARKARVRDREPDRAGSAPRRAAISALAAAPRKAWVGTVALLSIVAVSAVLASMSAPAAGTRLARAHVGPQPQPASRLPAPAFRDDRQQPSAPVPVAIQHSPR